jgi:hypothetical protein
MWFYDIYFSKIFIKKYQNIFKQLISVIDMLVVHVPYIFPFFIFAH